MPYKTNKDLPKHVAPLLPALARVIYSGVFNHAWKEYAKPEDRREDASREEMVHQSA